MFNKNILAALVVALAFAAAPAFAQPQSVTGNFTSLPVTATQVLDGQKDATTNINRPGVSRSVVHNTGAAGAIVLTLPACDAASLGAHVYVYLTAAQDVDINPQDADQILNLTNAAGDAVSSAATIGNRLELRCIAAGFWADGETSGTWTDVN